MNNGDAEHPNIRPELCSPTFAAGKHHQRSGIIPSFRHKTIHHCAAGATIRPALCVPPLFINRFFGIHYSFFCAAGAKKCRRCPWTAAVFIYCGLFFRGGTDGAVICTSAAGNASVSIDNVFAVTLGDSLYGAICCTSAAGDAFVTDFVCH